MRACEFQFDLPPEQIAKYPVSPRDSSRLLHLDRKSGQRRHGLTFANLPTLLRPHDLLVFNDTKVIPARLFAKTVHGGEVEILLLAPSAEAGTWECMVRPGKKVREGLTVTFADGSQGTLARNESQFFLSTPALIDPATRDEWLRANGEIPIPPYLDREVEPGDTETYQTVYAKISGSIAAPTAGLHFTERLLGELAAAKVQTAFLTLHVGYGTFAPLPVDRELGEDVMHRESYEVPASTLEKIAACRKVGGRVISVGTTTLRALESVPRFGPRGSTQIFIKPGHEFTHADGLITNFHLPESTLLILVSAFAGKSEILEAYREAVAQKYRFFSYGDAMLIV